MSLDVTIVDSGYSANITHNLNKMAAACGVYKAIWRPEDIPAKFAKDIIPVIEKGLIKLVLNPSEYKKYNAENDWGKYEDFVRFVSEYLEELKKNPNSKIEVLR